MKVLVCGGRDYTDHAKVNRVLGKLKNVRFIIQGGADGADALAKIWAMDNGVQPVTCNALWAFYDRPAGVIRNRMMIELCQIDLCIAFPGGKGTADMVRVCKKNGIKVRRIKA